MIKPFFFLFLSFFFFFFFFWENQELTAWIIYVWFVLEFCMLQNSAMMIQGCIGLESLKSVTDNSLATEYYANCNMHEHWSAYMDYLTILIGKSWGDVLYFHSTGKTLNRISKFVMTRLQTNNFVHNWHVQYSPDNLTLANSHAPDYSHSSLGHNSSSLMAYVKLPF